MVRHFQEACQIVIDRSDVLFLWGFANPEPAFDRLNWGGKPVVVTAHGSCEHTRKLLAQLERYATHFRAVSQKAAEAWGVERRHLVRVTYNGVDLNRLTPQRSRQEIRQALGIQGHHRVLAHLGRLAPDKNPLAVAQAVRQLGDPWRALYVGRGHAEDKVRRDVQAELGEQAIFAGAIEPIGDAFAAVDCVLLASPSEGHCQVLNEAWAAGVPVVSTRVGAVPELEKEYGPLVVAIPIDPTALELATAVHHALLPQNEERRRCARQMMLSRFTAAQMADDFSGYVHEIMQERTSSTVIPRPLPPDQPAFTSHPATSKSVGTAVARSLDCSIVITASRADLFPDALRHAQIVFPEYREIIVAASPSLPSSIGDLIAATPRCRTVEGTADRNAAAIALYRAMDDCHGEWIVHADDDDYWIQCDTDLVKNIPEDVAVVTGGALYCSFHPRVRPRQRPLFGKSLSDHHELNVPLNDQTAVLPGSFRLTRRTAWEQVRDHVPGQFEYNEYLLLLCLLNAGYRLHAVPEIWGVVRRFHPPVLRSDVPDWPTVYTRMLAWLETK